MKFLAVKCNICGADDYEIYLQSKTLGQLATKRKFTTTSNYVGRETLVRCRHCGLIYVNPRLSDKKIIAGYGAACEKMYVKESLARIETFKKCLSEIECYQKTPGKLLDIGCAAGLFLNLAKSRGWEVYGVEPNKWLSDWGEKHFGIVIHAKSFEKIDFKPNSFDVITFWDVLEHITDPKSSLLKSAKILRKHGYLVVNYPDISSWPARLFGRRWWFILSVHLYYFTPKSIKRILQKSGFRIIKLKPHVQRLSLKYLIYRLKPYNHLLHKILKSMVYLFKMGDLEVPYYAGQTMVIAQKL